MYPLFCKFYEEIIPLSTNFNAQVRIGHGTKVDLYQKLTWARIAARCDVIGGGSAQNLLDSQVYMLSDVPLQGCG